MTGARIVRHQRDIIVADIVVDNVVPSELRKELEPVAADEPLVNADAEKKDVAVAVKAVKEDVPAPESIKKVESVDPVVHDNIGLRQSDDATTVRPGLIQQAQQTLTQFISNNPIANVISNIRQSTPAPLPIVELQGGGESDLTTSRPNLIQQFQTGVQSIQNQIQSVFNPSSSSGGGIGSPNAAIIVEPTTSRPGFIQQIQGAIVPPIQGFVSGIQTNLQSAQNQITGIFRPQSENSEPVVAEAEPNVGGIIPTGGLVVEPAATGDVVTPQRVTANSDAPVPVVNQHVDTVDNKVDVV